MAKKKNVLNQIPEEKQMVVESEPILIDAALLTPEPDMTIEDVVAQEEFINEEPEEVSIEGRCLGEPDEEFLKGDVVDNFGLDEIPAPIEETKKERTVASLSRNELRFYQRTGIMPE